MKKNFLFNLFLVLILTIANFAQSKEMRLDQYLGMSQQTIQKVWGYPEQTKINSDKYLLWYYTYNHSDRIFYFDNNYVEKVLDILTVNKYPYAKQLEDNMNNRFLSEGFWILDKKKDRNEYIYTNGTVNIATQIINYNTNYVLRVLAYR